MNPYPAITLKEAVEWHSPHMAVRVCSEVTLLDLARAHEEVMTFAMRLARTLIDDWFALSPEDRHGRIIGNEAVELFINESGIESYIKQSSVLTEYDVYFVLSYCMGIVCAGRKPDEMEEFINCFSVDDFWSGFIYGYAPQREVLQKIIESESLSPQKMEALLTRHDPHTLYHFFGLPCALLAKAGDWELYSRLIARYENPEIQEQAISVLRNPRHFVELIRAIVSILPEAELHKDACRAAMDCWLEALQRAAVNYSSPLKGRHPVLRPVWNELKKDFNAQLNDIVKTALTSFVDAQGQEAVTAWLYGRKRFDSPVETEEMRASRKVTDLCKDVLMDIISPEKFDSTVRELHYMEPYAKYYARKKADKEVACELLNTFTEALKEDRWYFNSPHLTNRLIEKLHPFAEFLIHNFTSLEIINEFFNRRGEFRVRYEGINPTPIEDINRKAEAESQFLLLYLYLTSSMENKEKADALFEYIVSYVLHQCRCARRDLEVAWYYGRLLVLAEVIAEQRLPEKKEWFETRCVEEYPDILMLKEVFAQAKSPLTPAAAAFMALATTAELPIALSLRS